ncbi:MAG: type II toxin-antitoxin system VapB family antitoxin [Actinophytocola sp.]|nr:type II toxin-antitoxin system VapB family antitoxin [Actinophytocola sp.]
MARTNIDIDEEATAEVMRRYNLTTKRDAVNFALRKVAGPRLTAADLDAIRGIGWEGDLDELRRDRIAEW